jgi:DNA repair protein RadC
LTSAQKCGHARSFLPHDQTAKSVRKAKRRQTRAYQSDRPRERLFSLGEEMLSDVEILALILGTSGVRGQDVERTARQLLTRFGGIGGLACAGVDSLLASAGVGPARAAGIKAALELGRRSVAVKIHRGEVISGAQEVAQWFRTRLGYVQKEVFWALGLDTKNRLIRTNRVAEGHLCGVEVHPREAFRPLLMMGAVSVVFVHNHPSGDPEPSHQDLVLTKRLREVGRLVGITVLDHLIVGSLGYVSLAERGLF